MPEKRPRKILMIDDDAHLAALLGKFVEKYGYELRHAGTARKGLRDLEPLQPAAVLLDINLPDSSGLQLCRELRARSAIPIIIISTLGDAADRIVGLETGADDYLPKPFQPRELVARLESLLRRVERLSAPSTGQTFVLGDLVVDTSSRQVTLSGRPLEISSAEFDLLRVFAAEPGHVFSRDELLDRLKGIDWEAHNRSVDLLVSRLRKKLGDTPKKSRFLKTVWGSGYLFLPQETTRKVG